MKNSLIVKCLSAIFILLIIGISFSSCIKANIAKDLEGENKFIEITAEISGLDGSTSNKVKLTEEQSIELKLIVNKIKNRLSTTSTEEETIELFNSAIEEFNKYGLLGELTVEEAQNLIVTKYKIQNNINQYFNILTGKQKSNENYLCLVAGNTTETSSYGLIWRNSIRLLKIPAYIFLELSEFFENNGLIYLLNLITVLVGLPTAICYYLIPFLGFFVNLNPLLLGGTICIGRTSTSLFGAVNHHPSDGWIHTIGLNGNKNWTGPFYGQLPIQGAMWFALIIGYDFYPGIFGFTGIKINQLYDPSSSFYLGSALWAGIGPDRPS